MRRVQAVGFGVLLLSALALVPGCSSDSERIATHLADADRLLEEGNEREAMIELRSALQLDPQSADINSRIARALEDRNEYGDALFYYQEAFRLDPNDVASGLAAARILIGSDTDESKAIVETIIERNPGDALAHVSRSSVALVEARVEDALASALTATELAPEEPRAWLALGRVHQARIRQGRQLGETVDDAVYAAAFEAFERGVAVEGPAGLNEFERIRTLAITPDRIEEAGPLYQQLLEAIGKDDLALRANVGESLVEFAERRDDLELLRVGLREVIAFDPSNLRPWQTWARIEERIEPGEGEPVYLELLEERPDDPYVHDLYARYLILRDRPDDAKAHLRQAIDSLEANAPLPMFRLVEMLLAFEERDEAAIVIDEMKARFADHPFHDAARALRMMDERRYEPARKLLRTLTTRAVDSEFHRLLAICEIRLGNAAEAEDELQRAQQLIGGFDPAIQRLRARNRFQARDWARTVRTYRSIGLRGFPLTGEERTLLAIAQYQLGRDEVGRNVLEEVLEAERPPVRAFLAYAAREASRDSEKAASVIERGIELYPNQRRLLRARAQIDLAAGEPERALKRLDALVDAGAADPQLLYLRGQIRRISGDPAGAIADAEAALAAAPEFAPARRLLIELYAQAGRIEELLADLTGAQERGELTVADKLVLGTLLARAERGDEAIVVFEEVLQAQPDAASAKSSLARLLAERSQELDRALDLAQEAVAAAPQNANAADTLGLVFLRKDLVEPALAQFDAAVSLSGDQPSALYHYHRGLALAALGRTAEASDAIKVARVADPELEIELPDGVKID